MNSFAKIFVFLLVILVIGNSFKIGLVKDVSDKTEFNPNESCNITYFEYQSLKKIARNNYLQSVFDNNKQFTQGNERKIDNQTIYSIGSPTQTIFMSSHQNLTSYFGQNNDIIFEGAKVEFYTSFSWSKKQATSSKSGKGVLRGITKEIPYSIRNSQTTYGFVLNQVGKFAVSQSLILNITCQTQSSQNCTIEFDELSNIYSLLTNDSPNVTSIETSLENKVNSWLNSTLSEIVCCRNSEDIRKVQYVWNNTLGTSKFTVLREDRFSSIVKNGSAPGYYDSADLFIEDLLDQRCGPLPTNSSLQPKAYGGSQQFISITFMENFLISATRKGALSMILNDSNCQIQGFNFTAEALVPILSNISQTFNLSASVKGNCQPDEKTISIKQENLNQGFRIYLTQKCELFIEGRKIFGFKMLINSVIVPRFNADNRIDFQRVNWAFSPVFDDSYGFRLLNKLQVQNYMIGVLSKVMTGNLIGSDWPIFLKMQNPQILMTETAMVAYDLAMVQ